MRELVSRESYMRIAIIGAGLSGIIAGRALGQSHDVTVFEKSRGVSGRMSTRYADAYEFDHGAQYFTARDPEFISAVEQGIAAGHIAKWDCGAVYNINGEITADSGGQRYVGAPRMNSWCKELAKDLDVKLEQRVTSLTRESGMWHLGFENGAVKDGFDAAICAVPAQQASELLPQNFTHIKAVQLAKLAPCFALMVGLEGALDLGWETMRVSGGPIDWLCVNSSKPGRRTSPAALVVHARAAWSEKHVNADRGWIKEQLEARMTNIMGVDISKAPHRTLHRWLYASVETPANALCLTDTAQKISVCGDWCYGGRVEGAYLSGLAAAKAIESLT